jgi:hypothetical protein
MSRLARADLVVRRFALWLFSALTQLKTKIPSHPTFPVSPRGADLVDQVQRLSLGDAVTPDRHGRLGRRVEDDATGGSSFFSLLQ